MCVIASFPSARPESHPDPVQPCSVAPLQCMPRSVFPVLISVLFRVVPSVRLCAAPCENEMWGTRRAVASG